MKRRTALTGVGALVAGSVTLVGTGAFTSSSVERSVTVETADDASAYLGLHANQDGARATVQDGQLEFSLPPDDEDPDGLGEDTVYRFDRDTDGDEPGMFSVENRGTHPVDVYSTQDDAAGVPSVTMFSVASGALLTEGSPEELAVGENLLCGLVVDTHDLDDDEDNEIELQINAEATSE